MEQLGQSVERVSGDLHQTKRLRIVCLRLFHRRAQQRRFAHAVRAPQQHVMRRMACRQPRNIVAKYALLLVDTAQLRQFGGLDCAKFAHLLAAPDIGGMDQPFGGHGSWRRSEEHTSELQSLMRTSYAVFCLKKKILKPYNHTIVSTA